MAAGKASGMSSKLLVWKHHPDKVQPGPDQPGKRKSTFFSLRWNIQIPLQTSQHLGELQISYNRGPTNKNELYSTDTPRSIDMATPASQPELHG